MDRYLCKINFLQAGAAATTKRQRFVSALRSQARNHHRSNLLPLTPLRQRSARSRLPVPLERRAGSRPLHSSPASARRHRPHRDLARSLTALQRSSRASARHLQDFHRRSSPTRRRQASPASARRHRRRQVLALNLMARRHHSRDLAHSPMARRHKASRRPSSPGRPCPVSPP